MYISEELVLSAISTSLGTKVVRHKRRNFFQEIQLLMPKCMRKLDFDDDISLLNSDEDELSDESICDVDETTSSLEDVTSECFQPMILKAISSAVSRFAFSPSGNNTKDKRSQTKHRRTSVVPNLCCYQVTEDEHSARINAWVLSTSIYEKQTVL